MSKPFFTPHLRKEVGDSDIEVAVKAIRSGMGAEPTYNIHEFEPVVEIPSTYRRESIMHPKRHAFTLIELLVVIAIIAILAAILFPVFARAREAARKTTCLSDVKNIGLAALMHVQDYDEQFPWLMMDHRNNDNSTGLSYGMASAPGLQLNGQRALVIERNF